MFIIIVADHAKRLDAIEKQLSEIKETLASLKTQTHFNAENILASANTFARNTVATAKEYGLRAVEYAKHQYPKLQEQAQTFSKDFPSYVAHVRSVVTTQYNELNTFLTTFLAAQGVPKEYVKYSAYGIIALIFLSVLAITVWILLPILSFLCCCSSRRKGSKSKNQTTKKTGK